MRRRTSPRRPVRGPDGARLLRAARLFLEGIGETELERDMRGTPARVAQAWRGEILSGYRSDPLRILSKTIPAAEPVAQ